VSEPEDVRTQGIVALVPLPSEDDLRQVADTRWELDLQRIGPQPVEALWRKPPGTLFLTIGVQLKVVGAAIRANDDLGVLIRQRDLIELTKEFMRAMAEPGSPWTGLDS
jgi:hypothetical protein